ncbi:SDR family oxidoreductase [Mucilaginibacter aquariorum]|uniref:SDR family oxidoreductase n=1 Tax=Mucilaginibacter aquariorum TaxID=2967225 RepID=A0ABT1SW23_9SPHI|nr:SDR family oxidoreductase [Mucilaginibacter aquariorum]MCQ6956545.1 SDR family oxidoreductase [Mucilaginibacter aquariorum]
MTNYSLPYHGDKELSNYSFLVTGGAGFIGTNLVEYLLKYGAGHVRVLDNFSTGLRENVDRFFLHSNFELIEGDIRDYDTCEMAVKGMDFVLHQAALGSVPRSIADPVTTNEVNISGFLNVMLASSKENVKRVVYAASSSTYGDSAELPKVEERIGKPLSPYAITKYVNELYASVFADVFNLETIGLRYFNVFGKRQNPEGAYAAVIPKFVKQLMNYESPVINGDGSTSRDFTYIDNVVQMNIKAALTDDLTAVNQVYNVAVGERTTLNELINLLKKYLAEIDPQIGDVQIKYGPERAGDIAHSLASIDKAVRLLDYQPHYNIAQGLQEAIHWYAREQQAS